MQKYTFYYESEDILGCEDLLAGSHNFKWMFECWVV